MSDPMKRGVTSTSNQSPPDDDDFDMDTLLVASQVVFDHQRRWSMLSDEDVRGLQASPITSLKDVFTRFGPQADFTLPAERRDELIAALRAAGVGVAASEAILGEWAVKGDIKELSGFSPDGVASGKGKWDANILASLAASDRMYAKAAGAANALDFGAGREEAVGDLDAIIDVLEGME